MTRRIDIKHLLCLVCGSVILGSKKSTLSEIKIYHFVYFILSQIILGFIIQFHDPTLTLNNKQIGYWMCPLEEETILIISTT